MRPSMLSAVLLGALLVAAAPPVPATASGSAVAGPVSVAVAKHEHETVRASVGVWDAGTGEVLYELQAAVARRPASVAKIATTAAALLVLGPDHELATEVLATRAPGRDGVVTGDLIVRGGGDPGFSGHVDPRGAEAALRDLAREVRAAGVRRVTGDLLLDATAYPGPARHPDWDFRDGRWEWWRAPVTALTLNDACLDVTARPGPRAGAPAQLEVAPSTRAVSLLNRLTTVADRKSHSIAFGLTDPEGRVPVTGGVLAGSQGWTGSVACVDPVAAFGDVLRRLLAEQGVEVAGRTVEVRSPGNVGSGPAVSRGSGSGLVRVARHGTPVAKAVAVANTRSQNLFAELLCREVGRVRAGDGSFEGGARAVAEALGLAADTGFRQADGSGLSRQNQATVGAVGAVLVRMYRSPHAETFLSSLAKGGDPAGTLDDRFRGKRFEGRVFAKTGTLRDTSALAGYVRGRASGRGYAFVVLCEGAVWRGRQMQDAVVTALVDQ